MSSFYSISHPPRQNISSGQSGFGLIEVIVAVLILSIGLLGMASLQSTSLKQTTEARNRSQAVFLAQDILERARANRDNVADYAVAAADEDDEPACDTGFAIDNTTVSTDDINEWKNSLACLLPGGDGSVEVDDTRMTISVTWDASTGLQDDSEADVGDSGEVAVEAEI